jgi:hypothetical protein
MLSDKSFFQKELTLAEVVTAVRDKKLHGDDFSLYAAGSPNLLSAELACYVDSYPTVENDAEVFSAFVASKKLRLFFYGQQFEDVIVHAMESKPSAAISDYVRSLNHYRENDDFLDL